MVRLASRRLPISALTALGFMTQRRSAFYALDVAGPAGGPGHDAASDAGPQEEIEPLVRRLNDLSAGAQAWPESRLWSTIVIGDKPVDTPMSRWLLRRWLPLILWLTLLVPSWIFYGTSPRTKDATKTFFADTGFPILVVGATISVCWLIYRFASTVRRLPAVRASDNQPQVTSVVLRLWALAGSLFMAGLVARALLTGTEPKDAIWSNNFHALQAISVFLLSAGLAAIINAIIAFPFGGVLRASAGPDTITITGPFGIPLFTVDGVASWPAQSARTAAGEPSSLPPGVPHELLTPAAAAAINAAIDAISPDDSDFNPEPNIDHQQYEDAQGNVRWKDTNQLVSDVPTRSMVQDPDGTWRWADTQTADLDARYQVPTEATPERPIEYRVRSGKYPTTEAGLYMILYHSSKSDLASAYSQTGPFCRNDDFLGLGSASDQAKSR